MKRGNKFIDLRKVRINSCTWYSPKRNKAKLGILMGFVILCLVTPCTNWLMIPVFRALNKFPLWVYR